MKRKLSEEAIFIDSASPAGALVLPRPKEHEGAFARGLHWGNALGANLGARYCELLHVM